VAEVLDDLLGLPVTLGAVDVLEGRQCGPGDALGLPHHPLKRPVIADCAIASDIAQNNALNGASLEVCDGLRGRISSAS
jgi:hypothetical protein